VHAAAVMCMIKNLVLEDAKSNSRNFTRPEYGELTSNNMPGGKFGPILREPAEAQKLIFRGYRVVSTRVFTC
jgi:hypothetical protein